MNSDTKGSSFSLKHWHHRSKHVQWKSNLVILIFQMSWLGCHFYFGLGSSFQVNFKKGSCPMVTAEVIGWNGNEREHEIPSITGHVLQDGQFYFLSCKLNQDVRWYSTVQQTVKRTWLHSQGEKFLLQLFLQSCLRNSMNLSMLQLLCFLL